MSASSVKVVVTGIAWMGSGIGSIESTLEKLFREADQEIVMTVYSISTGSDMLFEWLEAALARGVKVRIVVNRFHSQHPGAVRRLLDLAGTYHHCQLFSFSGEEENDLHAKVIAIDRRVALVGSSNLSKRGLLANHELAVVVEGAEADVITSVLDRLLESQYLDRIQS
jgi:phosphatidylserine/phosphatidylglycerophosphate/cardiolipin synthase-like enzyme